MYIVDFKRPDGTIIQAIVKADNEGDARVRASFILSNMANGLRKSAIEYYRDRLYDFEDNWEFVKDEKQNFKLIKVTEFNDNDLELNLINGLSNLPYGNKSYRVTVLDGGCFYYTANNVRNFEEAYTNAVINFYRTKPVEGFVFELCQPYKVHKDRVRIIEYEYEVGKNNYSVVMEQYVDYSRISMQHNAAGMTFVGQAMTIEQMLGKLISKGTKAEKAMQLINHMLKINQNTFVWDNSDIKVADRNERFHTKSAFEDYLKYENVIDITHQKSVYIDWKAVEEKQKKLDEFESAKRDLGNTLGELFYEFEEIMSEEEKNIIYQMYQMYKDLHFGIGWGNCNHEYPVMPCKALDVDENDEDNWGTRFEDFSFEDTSNDIEPQVNPKKSSKPKSTKSQASKGSKKKGK